jgi:hypothetical protein
MPRRRLAFATCLCRRTGLRQWQCRRVTRTSCAMRTSKDTHSFCLCVSTPPSMPAILAQTTASGPPPASSVCPSTDAKVHRCLSLCVYVGLFIYVRVCVCRYRLQCQRSWHRLRRLGRRQPPQFAHRRTLRCICVSLSLCVRWPVYIHVCVSIPPSMPAILAQTTASGPPPASSVCPSTDAKVHMFFLSLCVYVCACVSLSMRVPVCKYVCACVCSELCIWII